MLCPSFQRNTRSTVDASGLTQTRDTILYFTNAHYFSEGHWVASPRSNTSATDTIECMKGPMTSDENSLPLSGVIEDGTVKRGEVKEVSGESCREFDVSVPTPHDPKEKDYQFTICINEQDHLPRETRRTRPGSSHEGVSVFTKWNAMTEPELPAEIPR